MTMPPLLRHTVLASFLFNAASLSSAWAKEPDRATTSAPEWEMIAFETKMRGQPVTRWQYTPRYGGVWIEINAKPGTPQPVWTRNYHTIEPDSARYAALEAIVDRLPVPPPDAQDCANFLPDSPYSTIRLTRGATTTEIAWNSGCLDAGYADFIAILHDANELVSGWGRVVPASRSEDHLIP